MSATKHYMPLNIGDYLADTAHLVAAEHGAYLLLIMHYWRTGGLPDDDGQLARITRCSAREWAKIRPIIAAFFLDGWRHKRIDAEIEKAEQAYERRAKAGQRGGKAKSENKQSSSNATAMHKQLELEPESSNEDIEPDGSCTKRSRISYPDDFEQFWQEYPTDPLMSKKQALAAWKRLGEEDREAARAAIQAFRSHCRSNPDYRPVHAERFLSQRRFDGFGAAPPGSARIDPDLARLAEIEAAARAKRQEGLNG